MGAASDHEEASRLKQRALWTDQKPELSVRVDQFYKAQERVFWRRNNCRVVTKDSVIDDCQAKLELDLTLVEQTMKFLLHKTTCVDDREKQDVVSDDEGECKFELMSCHHVVT